LFQTKFAYLFAQISLVDHIINLNNDKVNKILQILQSFGLIIISMVTINQVFGQTSTANGQTPDSLEKNKTQQINIGYGTVDKDEVTGNIYTIKKEDFNKGFLVSPFELIQGKVPGLMISSDNGMPGSNFTIRNRGIHGFYTSSTPLVIVDDVPLDNSQIFLNPNDIESVTVLKDASATAIYGEKAINGAILIHTQKGSKKLKLNYNVQGSLSVLPQKYDVFSAGEYRELINEKLPYNTEAIASLGNANTDWQKEIYRTSFGQDHHLSLCASVLAAPFRISYGNLNQDGIVKTSNLKRNTLGLAFSPELFDHHLKISLNHNLAKEKNRYVDENVFGDAAMFDPTQPVHANNNYGGYYEWLINGSSNIMAMANPVALLEQTNYNSDVTNRITNVKVDYKLHFFPDLRFVFNYGSDYYKSKIKKDVDSLASWTSWIGRGYYQRNNLTIKNQMCDFYLNYTKHFDAIRSEINFMAGYTYQRTENKESDYIRNTAQPEILLDSTSYSYENKYKSQYGRLIYNFKDKYILNLSLRRDGTSQYAKDNRWVLNPAAAFAWNIYREPFMQKIAFISDLKFRISYGKTGVGQSSDNKKYNLQHEEISSFNAGLDFGFLKDKITGSLNYYTQTCDRLIVMVMIPNGSNLSNYMMLNTGKLENKGWELALNTKIISSKNWRWDVSGNWAYNQNKIKTPTVNGRIGTTYGTIAGGTGNTIMIQSTGYPLNSFFVLQQVYGSDGKPLEGEYVNRSGEGGNVAANIDNYYQDKSSEPDMIIGIASKIGYKKWELSFSARANIGNYVYNNVNSNNAYSMLYNNHYLRNLNKSVNETGFNNPQYFSDYFVENASFLRMDYILLGYHFDKIGNKKLAVDVFTTVQNAFVITKYKGLDPEVSDGIDYYAYPRARIFSIGVNIGI